MNQFGSKGTGVSSWQRQHPQHEKQWEEGQCSKVREKEEAGDEFRVQAEPSLEGLMGLREGFGF